MTYFKNIIPFFLFLFCAGIQISFSQKIKQKYFTVNLYNPEDNSSIKADVCDQKKKIRYSDTLKYYWYITNKIIITQGGSEGRLLHGKYSVFYANNNLKEQGGFKAGLQNGQWMRWDNKGILLEIACWHNGYKQGKQIVFDSAGTKIRETSYKKGKQDGPSITYSNGKVSSQKEFKNGAEVFNTEGGSKNKVCSFFEKIKDRLKSKPKTASAPAKKSDSEEKKKKGSQNESGKSSIKPDSPSNEVQPK